MIPLRDRQYTLVIEPLQLDQMKSLFVDIDAQFAGEAQVDSITSRAADAQEYLSGPVNRYLDDQAPLK